MRDTIAWSVLLVAAATLTGCGTMQCCSVDDPEIWPIYGGVAHDWHVIDASLTAASDSTPAPKQDNVAPPANRIGVVLHALDLPLSAAADTVLLPITIPYAVLRDLDP